MNNYVSGMLLAGLVLVGLTPETVQDPVVSYAPHPTRTVVVTDEPLDDALNEVIANYCVRCHGERRQSGNMQLTGFDVGDPMASAELAEKVIHKLRAGMMPPSGSRRPSPDTLALLATTLENTLDAAAAADPNPGHRTFQRLNRAEYQAAVRDLFGLEIDASAFLPTETMSENFDNIADMQMLSATLMEGYLRAAAFVSRAAVGDPDATPSSAVSAP